MIVSHIGPPMGPFGDPWGGPKMAQTAPKRPKMAQNLQRWPKWSYKTQNGPSGTKTVLRDILYDYMLYWPTQEGP